MSLKTRYALIASVALLATGAGFVAAYLQNHQFVATAEPGTGSTDTAGTTDQLLNLALPDAAGGNQALRQWRGKLLVVNFWATWCPPCREEMPGFSRLQDKFSAKGTQFVGIAIDNADKVHEFSLQTPIAYPLLVGSPEQLMAIMSGLGNMAGGLPFTAIIGRDGTLRQTHLGLWKESALETVLADLTN